MAEVTKCFTWSMPDMYARGLCTMKLEAESDNTSSTCSVCVKPLKQTVISSGSSGSTGSSGSSNSLQLASGESI